MYRRFLVGLTGLALAGSVLVPLGATASATPAPAAGPANVSVDDMPSAPESKRRALREEALSNVLTGKAIAEKRGASTVV